MDQRFYEWTSEVEEENKICNFIFDDDLSNLNLNQFTHKKYSLNMMASVNQSKNGISVSSVSNETTLSLYLNLNLICVNFIVLLSDLLYTHNVVC